MFVCRQKRASHPRRICTNETQKLTTTVRQTLRYSSINLERTCHVIFIISLMQLSVYRVGYIRRRRGLDGGGCCCWHHRPQHEQSTDRVLVDERPLADNLRQQDLSALGQLRRRLHRSQRRPGLSCCLSILSSLSLTFSYFLLLFRILGWRFVINHTLIEINKTINQKITCSINCVTLSLFVCFFVLFFFVFQSL